MGSGGGSQTTTTGIDPEYKQYLTRVLGDVTSRYEREVGAGPDAIVAKMDPRQQRAIDMQSQLAEQAMSGTGLYNTQAAQRRDLENLMGSQVGQASAAGALGSARSQRAMQSALADKALEYQQRRQAEAAGGIEALGQAGSTLQEYEQQRLDAPHTSAQRYFGYLQNSPQSTATSGGGK
jgi:hypothetical protein